MRAALDTGLDGCLRGAGVHPGFSWRGVRVVNPLMEPPDSLLLQLLG
jgi:hypothetical protein